MRVVETVPTHMTTITSHHSHYQGHHQQREQTTTLPLQSASPVQQIQAQPHLSQVQIHPQTQLGTVDQTSRMIHQNQQIELPNRAINQSSPQQQQTMDNCVISPSAVQGEIHCYRNLAVDCCAVLVQFYLASIIQFQAN